jgi:hypothetical protein
MVATSGDVFARESHDALMVHELEHPSAPVHQPVESVAHFVAEPPVEWHREAALRLLEHRIRHQPL